MKKHFLLCALLAVVVACTGCANTYVQAAQESACGKMNAKDCFDAFFEGEARWKQEKRENEQFLDSARVICTGKAFVDKRVTKVQVIFLVNKETLASVPVSVKIRGEEVIPAAQMTLFTVKASTHAPFELLNGKILRSFYDPPEGYKGIWRKIGHIALRVIYVAWLLFIALSIIDMLDNDNDYDGFEMATCLGVLAVSLLYAFCGSGLAYFS